MGYLGVGRPFSLKVFVRCFKSRGIFVDSDFVGEKEVAGRKLGIKEK